MRLVVRVDAQMLGTGVFLAILIINLIVPLGSRVYAQSQSGFELIIQRAKELDQIESLPWSPWLGGQDGADWRWRVQFNNGDYWLPWEYERSGGDNNPDANQLNQVYNWTFDTPSSHIVRFKIMLWDDDTWETPDLADISSKIGEGVKDWNIVPVAGAVFEGVYNMEAMNFTSDSDQVQLRYNPVMGRIMYVASGEYDGTYGSGGLDAEVWFEVKGEFHEGVAPSDIAVMNVVPLRTILTSPVPNYILVDVKNNCSNIVRTYIDVYADNSVIATKYVELPAYQQQSFTLVWRTTGFDGNYIISARARQLSDETDISNNVRTDGPVTIYSQKACAIIVRGSLTSDDHMNSYFNEGCNQVYRTLRKVGLGPDDIWYLNQQQYSYQDLDGDGLNDVDDITSCSNLQWAIETWAVARANVYACNPLFIYLYDHGGWNELAMAPHSWFPTIPDFTERLYPDQLVSWLNYFQSATEASAHVIYDACLSGSFIDDLSLVGRVLVTASRPDEYSYSGLDGGVFSIPFWNSIKEGLSIGESFNRAYSLTPLNLQHPLLDDNGDLVGHMGQLPNGEDGFLADDIHIGGCEWSYPWVEQAMPRGLYSWPPPSTVEIWAIIGNQTPLSDVRAYMEPPDWTLPPSNETLVPPDFECFEMADPDGDGNWTVEVPSINFTDHAFGPSQFNFYVTAREENGDVATPSRIIVEFTNGTIPVDSLAPYVFVVSPLTEQVVYDQIVINGTATDDTCLKRIELGQYFYILGVKLWWPTQTITFPQGSTSYFAFHLNTTSFTNGPSSVILKAYDASGNWRDQNVTFFVNHDTHDIAVTNIEAPIVIERGQLVSLNVTVANHGSYEEFFDLDLYLNMTSVVTQTVNLAKGSSSTVRFVWNTSDFDLGCYTISSYALPVADENNTSNNLYVSSLVNLNEPSTYTLTIATTTGGTTDPTPGAYSYATNSSVQVTAIPDLNYLLDHWELDSVNVGSANPHVVLMNSNHTLKGVFTYSPPPPPLTASISPLSFTILIGQSITFTSTVTGGYTPYSYQWYLDGSSISGAVSSEWTYMPSASGIHYVCLKAMDANNSTAQSETARIVVTSVPVGGYSVQFDQHTMAKLIVFNFTIVMALAGFFVAARRKTRRR